jgi:large subunit ribosomal protein L15
MNLSNLKPAEGSVSKRKRIGRGEGSGRGGTSTRGHKGAQSRSGYSRKYKAINLSTLQALYDKTGIGDIDVNTLCEAGLVSRNDLVKILAKGELNIKLNVTAHGFSQKAKEAIEAKEGKIAVIE